MWWAHLAEAEQLLHQRRRHVRAAAPDPPDRRGVEARTFSPSPSRNGSRGGVGIERGVGRELQPPLPVPLPTATATSVV